MPVKPEMGQQARVNSKSILQLASSKPDQNLKFKITNLKYQNKVTDDELKCRDRPCQRQH